MKCNSCGMIVDEKWKYCPNCSKKIKNNKKILIILSVVFVAISCFIAFTIIKNNAPINEPYIKKSLSNKYNEKFSDIYLVKSVNNPDTDLNCDGSSFGTIKGEGTTEFYKVYSEKNNIEFFVYYDTSDKSKTIKDTYENYLTRRDSIIKVYDITKEYLNKDVEKFSISYEHDDKLVEITSKSQLNDILK